jgi:hypothetical protein
LSGGYAHAQPNKRMDGEGFARREEQGCKAWYVDAEAELKRAEALPIPGMRRANRKDCPRSASQRAECATSLRARVWSGHYEGLECRLKLGAHVDVNLHPQAGAEGGRCGRGAEPAQRAS